MIGNDMKKALFFLLTLFLVLLSSCKESDDESVMRFARKHGCHGKGLYRL